MKQGFSTLLLSLLKRVLKRKNNVFINQHLQENLGLCLIFNRKYSIFHFLLKSFFLYPYMWFFWGCRKLQETAVDLTYRDDWSGLPRQPDNKLVSEHCSKAIAANKLISVDRGDFRGGLAASGLTARRHSTAYRDKLCEIIWKRHWRAVHLKKRMKEKHDVPYIEKSSLQS